VNVRRDRAVQVGTAVAKALGLDVPNSLVVGRRVLEALDAAHLAVLDADVAAEIGHEYLHVPRRVPGVEWSTGFLGVIFGARLELRIALDDAMTRCMAQLARGEGTDAAERLYAVLDSMIAEVKRVGSSG
jgi:hypothetical protein